MSSPSEDPEFPLRFIFDDGECTLVETPESLLEDLISVDSTSPHGRVWVRDARDRTVALRVHAGEIELLSLVAVD